MASCRSQSGPGFAIIAILAAIALSSILWLAREPIRTPSTTTSDADLPLGRIWPFLAITLVSISAYSILQQVTALRLQDSLDFTVEESISRGGAALNGDGACHDRGAGIRSSRFPLEGGSAAGGWSGHGGHRHADLHLGDHLFRDFRHIDPAWRPRFRFWRQQPCLQ
ncbi:hypothetical protein [Sinorhizobium meliloti]|uniref:hypothetical protein n=1 Tax=Rhizobium meliloti TaxID=382 RepID=UPI0012FE35AD|nr:hypothetical protein [Sinorhizobium meliloti]